MLNKIVLMGRLTADPELRHTPNNVAVTSFTLAVDRRYAKQGEQKKTDFIEIVAWRSTAEFICRYFCKGKQVAVAGSLQTRVWKDKEGNNRKNYEVLAEEVFFADSKADSKRDNDKPRDFKVEADSSSDSAPFSLEINDSDFTELNDDDDLPF